MAAPARFVAPPIVHQALRSPGHPLDKATRAAMERRFGCDFGQVRIHADERAAESARAVKAKAYAVGNDVAFNRGEYQPQSAAGLDLLTHELAHVVQQTAGRAATIPDHIVLGAAGDAAEREAQQAGRGGWSRAVISVRDGSCLRRQPQQGDDQPEKKPKPAIQWGDWVFDPKIDPIGPLGGPSLEDLNKAWHYFDKPGGGASTCPPGWRMRYEGLCCPGYSVDVDRCCPLVRMTSTRGCCATDQYAKGDECVKYDLPTPTFPGLGKTPSGPKVSGGPPPESPLSRSDRPARERNVPSLPPLTVSLDIYFKQNLPGSIAGDDQALRDSLTASGVGTMGELVAWLKTGPQFSVQLTGRASIEGPPAHNRELGEYRAYSVATALGRLGLGGRIEDPPALPAACAKLADGIHNCADTTAAKTADPRDRQVRATLFIRGNP
jgi:outer membrane protein OmpA-like peptidoglycan-associated protein